jgi:hypothetical protein
MGMAREAVTAEARLIHYDLAGRYSVKAAQCSPGWMPDSRRATGGERPVLRLARPQSPSPARVDLGPDGEGS